MVTLTKVWPERTRSPIGAVKHPTSPFRSMVLDSSLHFLAYESPRAIQSFGVGVSYIAFMFLNVSSIGYEFNWGPCVNLCWRLKMVSTPEMSPQKNSSLTSINKTSIYCALILRSWHGLSLELGMGIDWFWVVMNSFFCFGSSGDELWAHAKLIECGLVCRWTDDKGLLGNFKL